MFTRGWAHVLASFAVAAWFSALAAACSAEDIVLGERGGTIGTAWRGSAGFAGDAADATSDSKRVGQAGVAADSGTAGSGAASAAVPSAGAPAIAGASGSAAGAGPPQTTRRPSSGCSAPVASARSSVEIYGMRASYSVALPGAYDRTFAYPLMVAFRPNGVTTDQFAQSLNLSAVAGSEAIIVYPNPVGDGATWDFMRDGPLFKALLPQMKSDYCVDEARVYALGDGAGALVANLVGCWNADDLRAIAPLSAAPAPPGPCSGSTAVWLVQSTSDAMLGAGMGNRDFWVGHNGCDVRMSKAVAPAQCVEYAGCDPRTPVRYCAHEGDTLPSYAASGAWDFFKSLD